jgi:putative serine protease PepD
MRDQGSRTYGPVAMSTPPFANRHDDFGLPFGRSMRPLIPLGLVVLGAAVGLALGLAIGAMHSRTTTVIESTPATASVPSSPSGPWQSVYAQAAPGTLDITVQATTAVETPFGQRAEQTTALGSGFVLDGQGHLVTAAHVVDGATSIEVAFQDGSTRSATIVGKDNGSDVAVLRVDPTGLTLRPLALGSSRSLAVGDALAVVGDPLGFDRSLSTGVVSGLDRTIEAPNGFQIAHAIQTDAAMNPGNSGGPIFDSTGRVVGIADQIATGTNEFGSSTTETSTGVGFAVPIDLIRSELARLEHGGLVSHPYLGISTAQGTGTRRGALVGSVISGTPAAKAGIRAGDLIVAFNAAAITSSGDLVDALGGARVSDHIKLTIVRGSHRITVTITLAAQPALAPSR